jgi:thiamine biosynthesis protein ThiI
MMRRGCRVVFVHFHSYPILSRASQEKARELAKLLTMFQLRSRLLLVPFGEIQQRVVLAVAPPLRVVIYRRFMMRIAEALAHANRAQALVTGEVVGQVASQTVENLTSINEVVTMPVLRPLIGMDKDEITAEAQRLGTYPVSIIPDQDCCRSSRRGIPSLAPVGATSWLRRQVSTSRKSSSRRWPRQPWKSSTSRNKMSCLEWLSEGSRELMM